MNKEEKYQKAMNVLRNSSPILREKESLQNEIMRKIRSDEKLSKQEKLLTYLFGWMGNYWLRGTMAVLATLLIGFFLIQQITIANRLNSLETQLVKTVMTINNQDPEIGLMQKYILNKVFSDADSITVSRSDLEELLNSYLELQKNDQINRQTFGLDSKFKKGFRESLKNETKETEL